MADTVATLRVKVQAEIDQAKQQITQLGDFINKNVIMPNNLGKKDKENFDALKKTITESITALDNLYKASNKDMVKKNEIENFRKINSEVQKILGNINTLSTKAENSGLTFLTTQALQQIQDISQKIQEANNNLAQFGSGVQATGFNNFSQAIINRINAMNTALSKGDIQGFIQQYQEFEKIAASQAGKQNQTQGVADWTKALNLLRQQFAALFQEINNNKNVVKTLDDQIENIKNGNAPLYAQQQWEALKKTLTGTKKGLADIGQSMIDAGQSTYSMSQQVNQLLNRFLQFTSITGIINIVRRTLKSAYEDVKELDEAMNSIAVVTDYTTTELWDQVDAYTSLSYEMGTSLTGAYEVSKLYYQQGRDTADVTALTTETLKLARIAGLEYSDATNAMTVALNAFNIEAEKSSTIVDVYSNLASHAAVSQSELATAMSKVASMASSVGMTLESTSAFLTQIIETTREAPETAGTALKTVLARFGEVKTLIDQGETTGTTDEGEEVDVNKIDTALKSVGVRLTDTTGQMRNLDDVLLELAEKWDSLDTMTQRYLATQAAGSRQQSRFLALMGDSERLTELLSTAYDSAGTSEEQFEKTQDSLETKLNNLKTAWTEFTTGIANSDLIKVAVEALTKVLQVVNKLTDAVGVLSGAPVAKLALLVLSLRTANKLILSLGPAIVKYLMGQQASSQITAFFAKITGTAATAGATSGTAFGKSFLASARAILTKFAPILIAAAAAASVVLLYNLLDPIKKAERELEKLKEELDDINEDLSEFSSEYEELNQKSELEELNHQEKLRLEYLEKQTGLLQAQAKAKQGEIVDTELEIKDLESQGETAQKIENGKLVNDTEHLGNSEMVEALTEQDDYITELTKKIRQARKDGDKELVKQLKQQKRQATKEKNNIATGAITETYDSYAESVTGNAENLINAKRKIDALPTQGGEEYDNLKSSIEELQISLLEDYQWYDERAEYLTDENLEAYYTAANGLSVANDDLSYSYNALQQTQGDFLEDLGELADKNQLTVDTVQELIDKVPGLEEQLGLLGITVNDLVDKYTELTEAEEDSTDVSWKNSLNDLKKVKSSLDKIADIYNNFNKDGTIEIDSLYELYDDEEFSGITEDLDEYINAILNAKNIDDVKSATQNLADAYLNQTSVLSNLTQETKDETIAQLELMGVTNAQALVEEKLHEWHEILLTDEEKQNILNKELYNDNDASTYLDTLADKYDTTSAAIARFIIQEQLADSEGLDFSSQIKSLYNLALKAGVAASSLSKTAEIISLLDTYGSAEGIQSKINSLIGERNTYYKSYKSSESEVTNSVKEVIQDYTDQIVDLQGALKTISDPTSIKDELSAAMEEAVPTDITTGYAPTGDDTTGSGSSKELQKLSQLYNAKKKLAQVEDKINDIQERNNQLTDYKDILSNQNDLLTAYQNQFSTLQELYDENLKLIEAKKQAASEDWADFYTWDDAGNLKLTETYMKILNGDTELEAEYTTEVLNDFKDWVEEFDDLTEFSDDTLNDMEKLKTTVRELWEDWRSSYIDLVNELAEIYEQQDQDEIDALQEKYDEMKEADDDYLDSLRKNIEARRDARERENDIEDIEKKQKRLTMLMRDTSGRNAEEIAQLQEELDEAQQQLVDDDVDRVLDAMEDANSDQQEQWDKEIETMEEQLEQAKENGTYIKRAEDLIQNNPDEVIKVFKAYYESEGSSQAEVNQKLEDIKDKLGNAKEYLSQTDLETVLNKYFDQKDNANSTTSNIDYM